MRGIVSKAPEYMSCFMMFNNAFIIMTSSENRIIFFIIYRNDKMKKQGMYTEHDPLRCKATGILWISNWRDTCKYSTELK